MRVSAITGVTMKLKRLIGRSLAEIGLLEPLRSVKRRLFGQEIKRDWDRCGQPVEIDAVYTVDGFEWRKRHAEEYKSFAKALWRAIQFGSLLDIGCGNGLLLDYLRKEQVQVMGVEGSSSAFDVMSAENRASVLQWDLRKTWSPEIRKQLAQPWDLVVCTEVAEHIEPEFEDVFLQNVVALVNRILVLSWSPDWDPNRGTPKQEHWNPRPIGYVKRKLGSMGLSYEPRMAKMLRHELKDQLKEFGWWAENVVVFRRDD